MPNTNEANGQDACVDAIFDAAKEAAKKVVDSLPVGRATLTPQEAGNMAEAINEAKKHTLKSDACKGTGLESDDVSMICIPDLPNQRLDCATKVLGKPGIGI